MEHDINSLSHSKWNCKYHSVISRLNQNAELAVLPFSIASVRTPTALP